MTHDDLLAFQREHPALLQQDEFERVGMTLANRSILKTGKARAIRFSSWRRCAGSWTVSRGPPRVRALGLSAARRTCGSGETAAAIAP